MRERGFSSKTLPPTAIWGVPNPQNLSWTSRLRPVCSQNTSMMCSCIPRTIQEDSNEPKQDIKISFQAQNIFSSVLPHGYCQFDWILGSFPSQNYQIWPKIQIFEKNFLKCGYSKCSSFNTESNRDGPAIQIHNLFFLLPSEFFCLGTKFSGKFFWVHVRPKYFFLTKKFFN